MRPYDSRKGTPAGTASSGTREEPQCRLRREEHYSLLKENRNRDFIERMTVTEIVLN